MFCCRMTVFFFAISGLDLLDALHEIQANKSKMVDWIYSLQIIPDKNGIGLMKLFLFFYDNYNFGCSEISSTFIHFSILEP